MDDDLYIVPDNDNEPYHLEIFRYGKDESIDSVDNKIVPLSLSYKDGKFDTIVTKKRIDQNLFKAISYFVMTKRLLFISGTIVILIIVGSIIAYQRKNKKIEENESDSNFI